MGIRNSIYLNNAFSNSTFAKGTLNDNTFNTGDADYYNSVFNPFGNLFNNNNMDFMSLFFSMFNPSFDFKNTSGKSSRRVEDLNQNMQNAYKLLLQRAKAQGLDISKIKIVSGFRSSEEQQKLYNTPGVYAAKPGTSMHEKGLAVDLSTMSKNDLIKMGKIWTEMGYTWGGNWSGNKREIWHFDLRTNNKQISKTV